MRRWSSALAAMVLALGCENEKPLPGDEDPTTGAPETEGKDDTGTVTESGQTTTEPPGETTVSLDETTAGTAGTTCSFVCDTTGGDVAPECDNFAQDCNDGEKCSAYADDGLSSWNNLKCVPVQENAAGIGEPCTSEGVASGVDSCAKGAMCWGIDPESQMGVCVELCTGEPMAAKCSDAATSCVINNFGVLNLCLGKCDPLVQDCAADELCLPNPADANAFICAPDASGEMGKAFDPCEYGNACDKGHMCQDPALAMECDSQAQGCCLPFCDLSAPECPGAGLECLSLYAEGAAPPGYENVGLCALPG